MCFNIKSLCLKLKMEKKKMLVGWFGCLILISWGFFFTYLSLQLLNQVARGFLPNTNAGNEHEFVLRGSNAYIGGTLKRTIKSWAYSPWNILSLFFLDEIGIWEYSFPLILIIFITFFYILPAKLHVLCSHVCIHHRHAKM